MTVTTGHPYTPIPEAFAAATGSTIADELPLYAVHLQAENKSPATVKLWAGAARQLHAYLQDHGMPTAVRAIRREHLESWLADLLAAGAKPSTVNNRYRSVQPLFRWFREEGLISENPMANMKAPEVPDNDVAVPSDADMRRLLEHTAEDKSFEGIRDYAIDRTSCSSYGYGQLHLARAIGDAHGHGTVLGECRRRLAWLAPSSSSRRRGAIGPGFP